MTLRVLLALGALVCAGAAPAHASISAIQTIDGPSPDIVGLDGAAMAPDGTGAIVYRRNEGGHTHVFVARFGQKGFAAPQRVDVTNAFDSYFPAIGAGDGGRLVVVWAQEQGFQTDRLYSSTLGPGASRFQAPFPIDLNIADATAVYPSLAMNAGGQALLSYRVVGASGDAGGLPPGYVFAENRLQRYNGLTWSSLGQNSNRNSEVPVHDPTAGNSPKIAIDASGNGIVAFQEPDDDFIDRIWARRIFGNTLGFALIASPQKFNNLPVTGAADAFSLDMAGVGQGAVAFRQDPGDGGAFAGQREMTALLPEASRKDASGFQVAQITDGGGASGLAGPSPPSVAVAEGPKFLTAFSSGGAAIGAPGDDRAVQKTERLDNGRSAAADPQADLAESGASAAAWKLQSSGRAGLAIRERRTDGVPEIKQGSGPAGGPVTDLRLSGSGLGDALVAVNQGTSAAQAIVAGWVDAPPSPFIVQTPSRYIRDRRPVRIEWDPAPHAIGGVTYSVSVDDERIAEKLKGTSYTIRSKFLDEGKLDVKIIATDSGGQETESTPSDAKVDRRKPTIKISRKGGKAIVVVSDGSSGSGISSRGVKVSWGDGKKSGRSKRGRLTHAYGGGGRHTVVVKARDKAGNKAKRRKRI